MATLMTGMHAHAAQCMGNIVTLHQDYGSATLCCKVKLMLPLSISKVCILELLHLRLLWISYCIAALQHATYKLD